jgi:micrococcal nuclease
LNVNKGIIIGIGIAIVGALFVIQDLGYQTNTDPNAPDPNANQDKFISPEPEPPEITTTKEPEPEPIIEPDEPPRDAEIEGFTLPEPKPVQSTYTDNIETDCSGNARCFSGTVTSVIDGDTIRVNDHSIRFAMASAPELDESGGITARVVIDTLCPVGSEALVDEDDGQTQGSYGRILAEVHCNGVSLNEELLDSGVGYLLDDFCDDSEFADTYWAQKHGCKEDEPQPQVAQVESDCDDSYPEFCIPSHPPDLDCGDIPYTNFKVRGSDPHRFDGDNDGIGCEKKSSSSSSSSSKFEECDPSYPDFCILPPPPDLDCEDIPHKRFTVLQPDPHRFDGDKDGIGCES